MVQIFRITARLACIENGVVVENEQEGVVPSGRVIVVIPFVRFLVRNRFAQVFDQAFALANIFGGKGSATLNSGATNFKRLTCF